MSSRTYEDMPAKFYRTPDQDYLIVSGVFKEDGRILTHTGAVSAIAGNPYQVMGEEFTSEYLKRCQRVAPDQVRSEWRAALNRYRNWDLPDAKMPNPFQDQSLSNSLGR